LFFRDADQAGIDGLVDFEKGQSVQAVDPVIGGGAQARVRLAGSPSAILTL
jgi:hypothetical protein